MTTTTTELSIAFSTEELTALTDLMGLGAVPGVVSSTAGAPELLAAARRSLRARGVLAAEDAGDAADVGVATAVADLLTIVTAPRTRVEVTVTPVVGPPRRHRYALTGPAGIDQVEHGGVHRFTPFAAVEVLARLADASGVTSGTSGPDARLPTDGVGVTASVLQAVVSEQNPDRRRAALMADGLSAEVAGGLAQAVAARTRTVTVRVRRPAGAGRVEGMDTCWAETDAGLISWPVPVPGDDSWPDGRRTVTLRPVDIREVIGDLAAAVAGSSVDGR